MLKNKPYIDKIYVFIMFLQEIVMISLMFPSVNKYLLLNHLDGFLVVFLVGTIINIFLLKTSFLIIDTGRDLVNNYYIMFVTLLYIILFNYSIIAFLYLISIPYTFKRLYKYFLDVDNKKDNKFYDDGEEDYNE